MSECRARTVPRLRGRMADAERVPMLSASISEAAVSGRARRESWICRLDGVACYHGGVLACLVGEVMRRGEGGCLGEEAG